MALLERSRLHFIALSFDLNLHSESEKLQEMRDRLAKKRSSANTEISFLRVFLSSALFYRDALWSVRVVLKE